MPIFSKKNLLIASSLLLSHSLFAADLDSIKRGEYIAKAGDCAACHSVDGQDTFSGGLAFPTPFGIVYSTNITPNKESGIGQYSFDEFSETLRTGVAPKGNLYPAMPYTSYNKFSDADMHDLWNYFQTVSESKTPNKENSMMFPANIRMGLKGWNLLFLDNEQYKNNDAKSAEWNRGAYLVKGAAHCGECHTPRNIFMATKGDPELQLSGSQLGAIRAPNIRPEELRKQSWTRESLTQLLHDGYSAQGVVNHEMFEVVSKSLRYLTADDINAIVTNILDIEDISKDHKEQVAIALNKNINDKQKLFTYNCAGCHGMSGEGSTFAPSLATNGTVKSTNPDNLIHFILEGIPAANITDATTFVPMPGQAQVLNNDQIAELANLLRETWGTKDLQKITVDQVQEIRERLIDAGKIQPVVSK